MKASIGAAIEDAERLRNGTSLLENMAVGDSATRSRELTHLLEEFEESRRAIRCSVVAAVLEEGATMADIGRMFGVSRQLANRLVKESRARSAERDGSPSAEGAPAAGD